MALAWESFRNTFAHSGRFQELLAEPVINWLFGDDCPVVVPSMLEERSLLAVDFSPMVPGPYSGLSGYTFPKSLMLLSHWKGRIAYGLSLRLDSRLGLLRRDRFALSYDPERRSLVLVIGTSTEDQRIMLSGHHFSADTYFRRAENFVATTESALNFVVRNTFTTEADCVFCNLREEPCTCAWAMKARSYENDAEDSADGWHMWGTAMRAMHGNCWMITPYGEPLRARTEVNPQNPLERVQYIMSMSPKFLENHARGSARWLVNGGLEAIDLEDSSAGDSAGSDSTTAAKAQQWIKRAELSRPAQYHPEPTRGGPPSFKCPHCDASFQFAYRLRRHVEGVHMRNRSCVCEICGKSYNQRSHLSAHIRHVHQKVGSVECHLCNAKFAWKTNLNKHMLRAHDKA